MILSEDVIRTEDLFSAPQPIVTRFEPLRRTSLNYREWMLTHSLQSQSLQRHGSSLPRIINKLKAAATPTWVSFSLDKKIIWQPFRRNLASSLPGKAAKPFLVHSDCLFNCTFNPGSGAKPFIFSSTTCLIS